DPENPSSVSASQLRQWQDEQLIECWGLRDNMPGVLSAAHIVALPTFYREGLPKILLEAASCGRPIVATDMPGCREVVRHEQNGLLVPPQDPAALAAAIARLVRDSGLRRSLGACGRGMAEREFSEARIVGQTIAVYEELLNSRPEH